MPDCQSPFLVAFLGRSGSSHLRTLLKQHPEIEYLDEPFRLNKRPKHVREVIDDIYRTDRHTAQGIGVKYAQAYDEHDRLHPYMPDLPDRCTCFFLKRDPVNNTISFFMLPQVKEKSGGPNLRKNEQVELEPIRVDPTLFANTLQERKEQVSRYQDYCRARFASTVEVTYEDLVAEEAKTLDRMAEALGVAPVSSMRVVHKLQKAVRGDPWDMILNRDEVKARIGL